MFIWGGCVPSRVKFFGWLAVKDHIQCRSNLLRKGILVAANSGCPICTAPLETTSHILFGCLFARPLSERLPMVITSRLQLRSAPYLWLHLRTSLPAFVCCASGQLWKHRNDVVFNGLTAFARPNS
jgi:hypothetical protein